MSSNNQQKAADFRLHQQLADDFNKQNTVIRTEPSFSRPNEQMFSSLQPDINLLETAFNLQEQTNSLREPANSLLAPAKSLQEPANSLPEPATINISLATKQLTSPIIDL